MATEPYDADSAVVIPFAPSYSITPSGIVTRIVDCDNAKAGRVLRQWPGQLGYMRIRLTTNGVTKLWAVHRLVCFVFHGEPSADKPFACHIDGNKLHNHASNLRWESALANSNDKWTHRTMCVGERAGSSKLTSEQVAEIRAFPRPRGSGRALARKFGVTDLTVSRIRQGRMRQHD